VLFDDSGDVTEVIAMGDYSSGRRFYCRIEDPTFHTLLIRSDVLVFHETTRGPFVRDVGALAPWAPDGGEAGPTSEFIARLEEAVRDHLARRAAEDAPAAGGAPQ
jgi:hypothetical protein